MTTITNVKPRAADLLAQMGPDMYRRAYDRGVSLSAWLEAQDPSAEYKDGTDAFQRMLMCSNIRTTSIPEAGVWADEFDAFLKDDHTRMLAPEWMARQWRMATTGRSPNTRAVYTSSDNVPGGALNPYFTGPPVVTTIQSAIPLDQIVAMSMGIRSNIYRSFYLTDVTAQERLVRVSEAAEIPRVRLTGSDHTIRLYKYGRVMEISYEQLRRQQIDLMALHVAQLAAQTEADKVAAALDILVNGDGNTNTAATSYNLTALDAAATVGTVSLKAWMAFRMKFKAPYMMTTALTPDDVALGLQLLNTGSANIPLVNINANDHFGGFTPINPTLRDNVGLGWTTDAPADKVVAFDKRMALLYLTEIGSDISEIERWAARQVQAIAMSEVNGFSILNPVAVKVLNRAA